VRVGRLPGVVFLVLAGCGLTEYEQRMLQTQRRVQQVEETNRLLDQPLNVPTREEPEKEKGKGPTITTLAYFFFRPPLGILLTPEKTPRQGLLYTYPINPKPPAPPPGSKPPPPSPFVAVEVAIGSDIKDLIRDVLRAYPSSVAAAPVKKSFSSGERTTEFETYEFDDPDGSHWALHFTLVGKQAFALAYHIAKGQKDNAARALQASLESFAAGEAMVPAKLEYNNGSPWKTGKQ
jgi:hypothetical protein